MKNIISISNLGKCYKVYENRNDRLKEWLLPFLGKRHTEKWVLKGINLEIGAGEAVGIIGMNGAGKSTLLKIITGTTVPTTGSVHFEGSVAALLELGLGFHPDFSGRQNVYMSGQLLGYSMEEIDANMAAIEAFAEIGEAIDAPVRTYSSGMQVRLAFSVATMRRPDILIVDEALSVGDSYFQHKSFGRIKKFCDAGTTLLLVSHDVGAIQAVCDRAVFLEKGEIRMVGEPQAVMDYYNAMLGDRTGASVSQEVSASGEVRTVSGTGEAVIADIQLLNSKGLTAQLFDVGEKCKILVKAKIRQRIDELTCGILIRNRLGESVFGTNSLCLKKEPGELFVGRELIYEFSLPMNFGEGNYALTVALHRNREHVNACYEWRDLAAVFEVVNHSKPHFSGMVYVDTGLNIR